MARINTPSDMARILNEIVANQGIANESALREELIKRIPRPVAWQKQNRKERLRPFADFIEGVLDPNSQDPRVRTFVRELAIASLSKQYGWTPPAGSKKAVRGDRRFVDLEDKLTELYGIVFQNEQLLRRWMKRLDTHCQSSSLTVLKEIDEAARGLSPVRKDVVLVGGGPLTAVLASILSAFFRVTVITKQHRLGVPWRYRQIYMNNTAEALDPNGPGLPLLTGSTMKIVGSLFSNLPSDLVLSRDTKDVVCATGRIARYAAGPMVGKHVATNIVLNSDEILVNQEVVASEPLPDGGVQLVLLDTNNGDQRVLQANAVFMATGPNEEQSKVPDLGSQQLYQESAEDLDESLRLARQLLARYRALLQSLETFPDILPVRVQRQRLRDQISQVIQVIRVPRIVTLNALEKIYEFWEEDLAGDPDLFPLADLISKAKEIAVIGDGDTGRTEAELAGGNGPESAYPPNVKRGIRRRKITLYNVEQESRQQYVEANRRRYEDVFTENTRAIPFKVSSYRLVKNRRGQELVEIAYRDAAGTLRRDRYPYAFDATGLRRRSPSETLASSSGAEVIYNGQGVAVGRGDRTANLFLVGAAAELPFSLLATELQEIIRALGIPENTLALWLNGLLAELAALDYVLNHFPTKLGPKR